FAWDSRVFSVNASIGLVEINAQSRTVSSLLSSADIACYSAKDLGRAQTHVYRPSDRDQYHRHNELLLASGIKDAMEEGRFVLYAQPIAQITNGTLEHCHYEVLLRMLDQQGEMIQPGAFIPAAERFGVMSKLDRWVIKNALRQLAEVNSQTGVHTSITINLSGQSLTDGKLTDFVSEQLQLSGVPPQCICFELTETAAISNLDHADQFIRSAKEIGCKFALDDFGSGLSSFAYIKHFPVDYLKIDGGFVKDINDDPTDKVMVSAINQMAHVLGMKTIAEFVENDVILEELQKIGVDMVQGFGIGKPAPFKSCLITYLDNTTRKAA
ncbi:MAG: EAL domain-containing protein, partial [Pseudomonadota bacterium]